MKKYFHVINIGIQNNLTYRFNFLMRTLFGLIPLVAMLYVWRTIYEGKGAGSMVGDYSLAQMISYYLLVTVVDALTAVNEDDWQIATDIKDGNISQFLLKPIDYLTYRFCLFVSGRLTYLAVAAVPLALFILYFHKYFVLPADFTTLGCFLLSTALTALLQFFMSYTIRLRIHRQRSFVSLGYSASRCGPSALLHAFPLPALFPRQYLYGQNHWHGFGSRFVHPGRLGHRGLRAGTFCLASWHSKIFRCRRVK